MHGWVIPLLDGAVARCMGPPACAQCLRELEALEHLELVIRLVQANGGCVRGRITEALDVEFTITFPAVGDEPKEHKA